MGSLGRTLATEGVCVCVVVPPIHATYIKHDFGDMSRLLPILLLLLGSSLAQRSRRVDRTFMTGLNPTTHGQAHNNHQQSGNTGVIISNSQGFHASTHGQVHNNHQQSGNTGVITSNSQGFSASQNTGIDVVGPSNPVSLFPVVRQKQNQQRFPTQAVRPTNPPSAPGLNNERVVGSSASIPNDYFNDPAHLIETPHHIPLPPVPNPSNQGVSNGGISPQNVLPNRNTSFVLSNSYSNVSSSANQNSHSLGLPNQVDHHVNHGIQQFTLDLHSALTNPTSNVLFSPISIASLLAMLTLGVRGSSATEIKKAILKPIISNREKIADNINLHESYAKIRNRLSTNSKGMSLKISNRMYVASYVNIRPEFQSESRRYYNCSIESVDFENDITVKDKINRWISTETSGLIENFIQRRPHESTVGMLINTIYFKGSWKYPFIDEFTVPRDFDTGTEVFKANFMYNTLEVPYFYNEELNLDIVALPYEGDEYEMVFMVPLAKASSGFLDDFERTLTLEYINELTSKMKKKSVAFTMPKMRIRMRKTLTDSLRMLGVGTIFSPSADFSGMTRNDQMLVSDFLHEAVMEVNEEGTVAAAVSGVLLDRSGPANRITVDRPSILFIREIETGLPIFWARLNKPEPLT